MAIIEIQHLNKSFTGSAGTVVALEDINLSIEKGEIFGIIGLSGAGKSTLVRCINQLEIPTAGKVLFEGTDLCKLNKKQLLAARQQIGMIFQGFNLLAQRNALQNVCFPMEIAGVSKADAKKRALALLELVGLSDRVKSYPAQLSGGQKQRVAIARALANNPKVLLCDEATSALDPTTTASILNLLKDINQKLGVTVIVITHEMKVIEQICHRVAVIDQSHIVEMGSVGDIFVRPKSAIARKLIFPAGQESDFVPSEKCLRVVFDGASTLEPIVADMILQCGTRVNILYAHTKTVDGKIVGQMVFRMPEDDTACERIKAFLNEKNLVFTEENFHE